MLRVAYVELPRAPIAPRIGLLLGVGAGRRSVIWAWGKADVHHSDARIEDRKTDSTDTRVKPPAISSTIARAAPESLSLSGSR